MKLRASVAQVLLVLSMAFLATATEIKKECLKKLDIIAGRTINGAAEFDWTDDAVEKFNTESVPVLKRSCLADDGLLHSFRMVVRGYENGNNILTPSAGPSEFGNCANKRAPIESYPVAAQIFYDLDRVHGVEFLYAETTSTLLVGNKASEFKRALFDEKSSWIGFYGTQGADRIHTLGFIVQDIACSEPPIVVPPVDEGSQTEDKVDVSESKGVVEEEKEFPILMVAIIGGGGLFVIILFIVTLVCCCKKDKKPARPRQTKPKEKIVQTRFVVLDPEQHEPESELELIPPPQLNLPTKKKVDLTALNLQSIDEGEAPVGSAVRASASVVSVIDYEDRATDHQTVKLPDLFTKKRTQIMDMPDQLIMQSMDSSVNQSNQAGPPTLEPPQTANSPEAKNKRTRLEPVPKKRELRTINI